MRPFWLTLISGLILLSACSGREPARSPAMGKGMFRRPHSAEHPKTEIWHGDRYPWEFKEGESGLRVSERRWNRMLRSARGGSKSLEPKAPHFSKIFDRPIHGFILLDPYGENSNWEPAGNENFAGIVVGHTLENQGAVYIESHEPEGAEKKKRYEKERDQIEIDSTHMDIYFKGEPWTFNGKRYRLVNIGGRTKSVDQPLIDSAYASRGRKPGQVIVIRPTGFKDYMVAALRSLRSKVTDMLIHVYAERNKGKEIEILPIESDDERSDATDYLLLIEDGDYDLAEIDVRELVKRSVATIQLHRDKPENYDFPTVIKEQKGVMYPALDPLAFERRLDLKDEKYNVPTMKEYREKKGDRNVAEVTRYAAFTRFPKRLRDALWCKIFDLALEGPNPVGMLVFTVGPEVEKALADLEFDKLGLIKASLDEPETLKYLYTDSDAFRRVHARLRKSAAGILPENGPGQKKPD